jgi:hypothetical protein
MTGASGARLKACKETSGEQGRYVGIELLDSGYLSLAEVQV